jgi:hypothetical protein
MDASGFRVFDADPATARWAAAAHGRACAVAADPDTRAANLRHAATWFVGVDALPNAADGSIEGVPLDGTWRAVVEAPATWHPAQLSIVYPGYPGRDAEESAAAHRYRVQRHAAHVDGLLPEGPRRRRFLREPHAFILGLPLNLSDAAPLMVWPGSHRIMGDALRRAIGAQPPGSVDVTEAYQEARRAVFARTEAIPLRARPGQAMLLHRHLLHGVAACAAGVDMPPEGRMIAYLRPQMDDAARWLQSGA